MSEEDALNDDQASLIARLQESEEFLSRLVLGSAAGITVSSVATGAFVYVNDAFLRFTGYWRAEVLGHSAISLGLWASSEERSRAEAALASGNGIVPSFEMAVRTKSGAVLQALLAISVVQIRTVPCVVTVAISRAPVSTSA
jgi:two-component system cell cycle sensor histidine kinase/response regulator CckA